MKSITWPGKRALERAAQVVERPSDNDIIIETHKNGHTQHPYANPCNEAKTTQSVCLALYLITIQRDYFFLLLMQSGATQLWIMNRTQTQIYITTAQITNHNKAAELHVLWYLWGGDSTSRRWWDPQLHTGPGWAPWGREAFPWRRAWWSMGWETHLQPNTG